MTRRTAIVNPVATARIAELVGMLRERDTDPAYATAPRLDTYARISPSADPTAVKVERQTTDVLEMLLRGNYRLGETLIDWNLSAWKPRGTRPAFQRGLARIASGESNGIAAWNSDRLTRQLAEAEQLITVATVNRAVFLSYSGEFDLSTSDGRMMLRLQTMFAQQESDRKSERLSRKYAAQRDGEGRKDGLGGYQSVNCFGHGGRDEATLEAERAAIAWAIPMVTSGAVTWQGVADEWNRRGLASRGGQRFNVTKVHTILTQPRHAGYLTLGEGTARRIVGEAHNVVAIVDKATWSSFTAVLASRAERKGGRPSGVTPTHLLGGLLRCALCGNTLLVSGPSYRCNGAVGCRRITVNAAVLDAVVGIPVVATLSDPKNARRIAARSSERGRLETELERARERKRRFTALYLAGDLDDDEYARVTTDNATMIRELEGKRDAITDDGPTRVHSRDEAEREWDKSEGNREERRELVLSAYPLGIAVLPPTVARVKSTEANTLPRLKEILPGWLEGFAAQRAA